MKCRIINIGDELLLGQVVNTNASSMAQMLSAVGVKVDNIEMIPDELRAITQSLQRATGAADVVILSGGLGPTKDDVTKHALASFFGTKLTFRPEVFRHLTEILSQFGKQPTSAHKAQCKLPENARLLHNALGTAPGMYFQADGSHIYVVPGVPHEMLYIMNHSVIPELESILNGQNDFIFRTVCTAGKGESEVAMMLQQIENTLPDNLTLAYLPKPAQVRVRLTATSLRGNGKHHFEETWNAIISALGSCVYATEDISLSEAVGRVLRERGKTVAVAESCTGGYIGHLLTSIPGSSDYFIGGGIVYSNAMKQSLIHVPENVLDAHGAVSQETVEYMVRGALEIFGADYAIATSGVAGPGGGSPEKPVGTVWIAVGDSEKVVSRKLQLTKDRERNIEMSAVGGLNLLRKFLQGRA